MPIVSAGEAAIVMSLDDHRIDNLELVQLQASTAASLAAAAAADDFPWRWYAGAG